MKYTLNNVGHNSFGDQILSVICPNQWDIEHYVFSEGFWVDAEEFINELNKNLD